MSSSSAPVSWSTRRIDRRTLPRWSTSSSLTLTSWPSVRTSRTFSTRSFLISRDVDQPVLARHEGHERAEIDDVGDLAGVDRADLGLGDDAVDPLARGLDLGDVGRAILITPSSSMSTLAPVVATISRMTLPPVPMISRILSLGIDIVSIRGAWADSSSRVWSSALAISPRMCARPSLAWAEGDLHDLLGDAGDLDVHLQRW